MQINSISNSIRRFNGLAPHSAAAGGGHGDVGGIVPSWAILRKSLIAPAGICVLNSTGDTIRKKSINDHEGKHGA